MMNLTQFIYRIDVFTKGEVSMMTRHHPEAFYYLISLFDRDVLYDKMDGGTYATMRPVHIIIGDKIHELYKMR